ncbi:hypothetical protein [Mycobacterium sp.]|uniref:hypothetical protein n=1 Tax=Mycobacterium sp. TaxID=1785 RepID=UPI003A89ED86
MGDDRSHTLIVKLWLPLVALVTATAVGYGINEIQRQTAEIGLPPVVESIPPAVVEIHPKNAVCEVFEDLGGGGRVVYASLDSQPIDLIPRRRYRRQPATAGATWASRVSRRHRE